MLCYLVGVVQDYAIMPVMILWPSLLCGGGAAVGVVVVVLLTLAYLKRRAHFGLFRELGLPGPTPSLLTGNLSELSRLGITRAFLEWSRFGENYGYFYGLRPIIVTTDSELLHKVIFKDAHLFYNRAFQFNLDASHPTAGRQVHVLRDPVEIKAFRTQFTSAFTANKLKKAVNTAEESVRTFMSVINDLAASCGEFEITEPLRLLAMDAVGRTSFGLAFDVQKTKEVPLVVQQAEELAVKNLNTVKEFIATCLPRSLVQPVLKVLYATNLLGNTIDPLTKTIGAILDVRQEEHLIKRHDIIDNLVSRHIFGRPMTRPEIVANATVAFFAGFDTLAVTLAMIVFRLGRHSSWQDKIREDITEMWDDTDLYGSIGKLKKLEKFVCETLRLDPPAPAFVTREAAEDYRHGELFIPKGTSVQAPLTILHRDPKVYPDPDEFDPEHFSERVSPVHFMPFGEGPRNCVGMRFALLQVKLAVVRLLQRYHIHLGEVCKDMRELTLLDSGILRRPAELVVRLDPVTV